jgi:hypothetical protein
MKRSTCAIALGVLVAWTAAGEGGWSLGEKQKLAFDAPFALASCAATGFDPACDLVDWDGDGLLDLLTIDVTAEKGYGGPREVLWFRNVGTKTEPKFAGRTVLPVKAECHNVLAVADLDGDGKKDILICRPGIRVAYNRGTPTEPKFEVKEVGTDGWDVKFDGPGTAPVVVDWDGDGKLDLVAGVGHNGRKLTQAEYGCCFYRNVGAEKEFVLAAPVAIQTDGKPIKLLEPSPCPADVNGDGRLELLIAAYGGAVFLYENKAEKGKLPELTGAKRVDDAKGPLKGSGGRFNILHVGDLNGDGVPDLVETGEGSRDTVWFWPGRKN